MKYNVISILFLFSSISMSASEHLYTYHFLEQHEYVATAEEAAEFKKNCEIKKNAEACYNFAAHLAQELNEETKSLGYYQIACDLKYEVGCFNLGGILIKKIETRAKGIEAFQKSCIASRDAKASPEKKKALNVACELIPIIEKHMTISYYELYQFLKTANPPPHQTKNKKNPPSQKLGVDALKKMNTSIDNRLMILKKSDTKLFKFEMALQKTFNDSVKNFCSFYENECEGSVCSYCIDSCYSALYEYRKRQSDEINSNSLTIKSKINSNILSKKYFSSFADSLCQISESVWAQSNRPKLCSENVISDIQSKVISQMIDSDENEGDVCAQLTQ